MLDNPQIESSNIKTRSGLPVMIFACFDNQDRHFFGVYRSEDEWHSATWDKEGFYIDSRTPRGLDLVILGEKVAA